MLYLQLFWEFFRVGLFAIGGGLATLPFLYELSEKTQWFQSSEIINMLAVSEATPGAVGVNMATYAGYSVAGICGAVIATLGLVAPSILIVTIVFLAFQKLNKDPVMQSVLAVLRPTSLALICFSGLNVFRNALLADFVDWTAGWDIRWKQVIICLLAGMFWKRSRCHPAFPLLFAAVLGMIFGKI